MKTFRNSNRNLIQTFSVASFRFGSTVEGKILFAEKSAGERTMLVVQWNLELWMYFCIFVFCTCVFAYLCIRVFVNLCTCVFAYLYICVFAKGSRRREGCMCTVELGYIQSNLRKRTIRRKFIFTNPSQHIFSWLQTLPWIWEMHQWRKC